MEIHAGQKQNNRYYIFSQTHTSQTNTDPANNTEQTEPSGEDTEKHSGIKKVTILLFHI